MQETRHEFRAMNTEVRLVVLASPSRAAEARSAVEEVEHLFHDVERRLSRFIPDSELCQLNASAGHPFQASPLLFEVVSAALNAAEATGGLFDPTILGALVSAGYDRSFEQIAERRTAAAGDGGSRQQHGAWWAVILERQGRSISLPFRVGLDLGGIGKGWTVDEAARRLRQRRIRAFVVDAGGDIAVHGTQPGGAPWQVAVENPARPDEDLLVLALRNAAVATSSTGRRAWMQDGARRHHLIDPRTGAPAETGVVAATVVAESVARAEVLTKAALLLGPAEGLRFIERQGGVAGVLVTESGQVRMSRNLDGRQDVA